ncbi:hypothetical protein M0805_009866 [Coniferiporia weirii]|nr:hypothetical protein M0805_009866 [Coniferiporia weirii]
MSFSGTPLGQDRRLDHHTFLKGASHTYTSKASPPRRVPSINSSIPLSYAYGAPTLSVVSPTHSPSNSPNRRPQGIEEDDEERSSRYAQLKQRNQALAGHPRPALGPGIITTPPQPTAASLKDTSVNIASAFSQAASSYLMAANPSNSWSNGRNVPRSTSVEYEQQTQNAAHRRLAVPPRRVGGSKPLSKAASATRGSDMENDHSGDSVNVSGRAKSPFDHLSELTSRAMSSATFLMRQRSQEPEEPRPPSRQATDATLVPQNNSNSYDYADEEEEFLEIQKTSKKSISTAHKRNRMSTDNKAYRPTASDLDEESDEDLDGERKGRRRRRRKEGGGGPLRTLPVTQYDKRKKKRARDGKPGDEELSESDEQEQEQPSEQRSQRSATPLQRQPSVPRGPAPPPSRGSVPRDVSKSYSFGTADDSADVEQALDSIPEVDELNLYPEVREYASGKPNSRPRSRSRSRVRSTRTFSIGAFLGSVANMCYRSGHFVIVSIFRLLAVLAMFIGKIFQTIINTLIFRPISFVRRGRAFLQYGKYILVVLILYAAIIGIRSQNLISLAPSYPSRAPYVAPERLPENVDELVTRLLKLENMLAGLQADSLSERNRLDIDLRRAREIASRVGQLETRIDKEVVRAQKLEEESRISAYKGIESLQHELRALKSQRSAEPTRKVEGPVTDEEARAKLRTIEDRLGSVEGGVKEALELGQSVAKVGSVAAGAVSGTQWWNKIASGSGATLSIKSSDGRDVTSLIGTLVEQAVAHHTADGVARVDYALSSGGANVIPSLTSRTLEVRESFFFGLISGSSIYARSPVTALHHETHLGYCWPMPGSHGHLGVKLAAPVRITDFTIDHVAHEVAHDMRPAPRHMEVWGLVEGQDNLSKLRDYRAQKEVAQQEAHGKDRSETEKEPVYPSALPKSVEYMRIATFMYDVHAPNNIQTFSVPEQIKTLGIDFGLVVLFVNSNWGREEFTCLYRFRVHGDRAQELPALDP